MSKSSILLKKKTEKNGKNHNWPASLSVLLIMHNDIKISIFTISAYIKLVKAKHNCYETKC